MTFRKTFQNNNNINNTKIMKSLILSKYQKSINISQKDNKPTAQSNIQNYNELRNCLFRKKISC